MKVLMNVSDSKGDILRQEYIEATGAMIESLVELQKGNTVAIIPADDLQLPLPVGFIFDTRLGTMQ